MKQPDRLRAERAWSLLVVWLLAIILTNVSPAPASAASPGEFQPAAAILLPVAGSLEHHPALGDRPFDDVNGPATPASIDETERERQMDAGFALDCLPSVRIALIIHTSAVARPDDVRLPEYWVSYGIRDLRGPPAA